MRNREELLAVDDVEVRKVEDVPFWGDVFIRSFSAGKRDEIEAAHLKDPYKDFRARFVVASVCDEKGNLIFKPSDIPAVSQKSAKCIDMIFGEVAKLNRITKDDVEELEKNSSGVQPDA